MTRESKLALIIGFVLVLVVGVLVSDHFSQASTMTLDRVEPANGQSLGPITDLGEREQRGLGAAISNATTNRQIALNPEPHIPVEIRNGRSPLMNTQAHERPSILDRAIEHVQEAAFPQAAQLSPRSIRPLPVEQPEVRHPTYKVVSGDSLIKIARKMLGDGERWSEIHTLNADVLGPDAILKIGVYLKLPLDTKVKLARSSTTRSASPSTYTVVSGDTLGQISMRLLGTFRRADEIVKLNGLESANDIRIGMKLKIPAK